MYVNHTLIKLDKFKNFFKSMNDDYIEKPDIDVQKRVILESDHLFCGLVDFGQFSSVNSNFH